MPVVKVEPTKDHPVPYDTSDEKPETVLDELAICANTASLLDELGAPLEVDSKDFEREKKLIDKAIKGKQVPAMRTQTAGLAAREFLREYGQLVALDVAEARAAITYKLMEIANCGDTKYELKALELLGKHSDIGLFTERSEITINYKDPTDLENAIKERVKRLLNADIIDVTPIGMDLDQELGIAGVDDIIENNPEEQEETEEGEE
jgi:hypothetical protein